jgi:hypothetical protein
MPPEDITHDDLTEFIRAAYAIQLSPSSIKGTIAAIRTLVKDAGRSIAVPIVRVPPPDPKCFPSSTIDAIWPHLSVWGKQHVALTYHCCFRLDDIIRLQLSGVPADLDIITLQASKTQRRHAIPVPVWLRQWLGAVNLPFSGVNDWTQAIIRAELDRCCHLASIVRILPSQIRKAGLTAWGQANGMAGEIVHGCGLSGVMRHYIDRISILESAATRVRIPDCFRGSMLPESDETTLLNNFRRMDPTAQRIISTTAERLAAG